MAVPFVKMPGTGKPDPPARRPGKIPIPRDARTGPAMVVSGASFVLAVIYAGAVLVALLLSVVVPGTPVASGALSMVLLVTLATLVHILGMGGDSISRSGNDWGMRAITLFWVASGCWILGGG